RLERRARLLELAEVVLAVHDGRALTVRRGALDVVAAEHRVSGVDLNADAEVLLLAPVVADVRRRRTIEVVLPDAGVVPLDERLADGLEPLLRGVVGLRAQPALQGVE